jgi:UDP-glucose 4-epimerase
MKTHLIVGGCGFIGRHVAVALARRGHRIVIADPASPSFQLPPDVIGAVSFVDACLTPAANDDLVWDRLVEQADVVHHLAWSTIPASANRDPLADIDFNLRVAVGLLEALRRRGGGRLIFSSSGGTVYGRLQQIPVSEDHPLEPVTAYGVSKLAVEKYCGVYRHLHGLDCRIARLSNPFGAGQDPYRGQGAVTAFVHRALKGAPLVIWGDGSVVRDYIHVSDAADAFVRLAELPAERLGQRFIYNIGSGVGVSLAEIVDMLGERLQRKLEVRHEASRPFDIPVSILDISAAKESLGWQPRLSFGEGLSAMIRDLIADGGFTPLLHENA